VVGDSSASLSGSGFGGLTIQLGGSAAGFAIFYFILSRGLSPVWALNIFLDDQSGNRFTKSIIVEVRGNPRQEMESSSGNITFAFLPKGVPAQLAIVSDAYALDMDKIVENSCVKKAPRGSSVEVASDCNRVTLVLAPKPITFNGIKDFSMRGSTEGTLTLGQAIADVMYRVRQWGASRNIVAEVKFGAKATAIKDEQFRLKVDYARDATLCLILAEYRDQFNQQNAKSAVGFSVGQKTIHVLSGNDKADEDDQCK
jgi:hypothetical protein